MSERSWRAAYERLRAVVVAGGQPEGVDARRLARLGVAGLATTRPAWEITAGEAPEPRWTGADPRLAALCAAFEIVTGGT